MSRVAWDERECGVQVSGSSYRLELWHGVDDGLLRVFSVNRGNLELLPKILVT
jgi:hypothetical protein